jgi:hypothetical protein
MAKDLRISFDMLGGLYVEDEIPLMERRSG